MNDSEARQLFQQLIAVEKVIENKVKDLRAVTEEACGSITKGSRDLKALSVTNPDDNFSWQVRFRGRPLVEFTMRFGHLPDEADPGLGLVRCQIVPLALGLPETTLDLASTGDSSWEWRKNGQPSVVPRDELSDMIFNVIVGRLEREFQRYRV